MQTVTSPDGTRIAFDRAGTGHPLIFATGAFNDHTTCAALARALAGDHTVITYDRRGRGHSADTTPYAIAREVEDLSALIDGAGGSAAVFGYSSGAVLALKAAADGAAITHLALYEPPFALRDDERASKGDGTGERDGDGGPRVPADLPGRLADLVARGRRGDAVALFQTAGIGLPAQVVAQIRQSPMWPALEAMAQSVVYDATITTALARPTAEMIAVRTPILVLNGAETWPDLRRACSGLASLLPGAVRREVPGGQNHDIPVAETATALREFLGPR